MSKGYMQICGSDFLVALFMGIGGASALAQCPETKLTASDAHCPQYFGGSIAIDGDVLVAGAPGDGFISGTEAGAAYVFRRGPSGWAQEQKLVGSDGQLGDLFGTSVAVLGDIILVGARDHNHPGGFSGTVYSFRWNGTQWVEEQELGAAGSRLGGSVALNGDRAALGAPGDEFNQALGAIYVFRRVGGTWVQEQKLTASDSELFDGFGRPISLDGNVLAAGATGQPPNGAVYLFRWNGSIWTQEQKLSLNTPNDPEYFGSSVAVRGNVLAIGATDDAGPNPRTGGVFIFGWNGASWVPQQWIVASDGQPGDAFGNSVALGATCLLVGSTYADTPSGVDSGAAYLFGRTDTQWTQGPKLAASDGGPYISTVHSVALSDSTAVFGAGLDDDACPGGDPFDGRSGAVYTFDTPTCFPCFPRIPTLSAWSALLLGLLLLGAGCVIARRRTTQGAERIVGRLPLYAFLCFSIGPPGSS